MGKMLGEVSLLHLMDCIHAEYEYMNQGGDYVRMDAWSFSQSLDEED